MEPPYPRIKLCRARKTDLSIFILRLLTSGMSLAESPSFYLISFCHRISRKTIALSWLHIQSGEGRGEYSGFQVTGMIERGQKSKPKKSLGLQTNSRKIPEPKFHAEFPSQNNLFAELRGRDTWELSRFFRFF